MAQTKARLKNQIETVMFQYGIQNPELLTEIMALIRPNKVETKVIPAAVDRYRTAMAMWPPKDLWQSLAESIGDDPAVLDRWELHCQEWRMKGYRVNNFTGLFDSFKAGGLMTRRDLQYTPSTPLGYDVRGQLAKQMAGQKAAK